MTFGQHLEELRVCLFKSIFGLFIGCTLGLAVSLPVVRFLQSPAENALNDFYEKQAKQKIDTPEEQQRLAKSGYGDAQRLARLKDAVTNGHVTYDVVWIDPAAVSSQLELPTPNPEKSAEKATENAVAKPAGASVVTASNLNEYGLKGVVLFKPLADDARVHMGGFNVQEPFMVYIKASLLVGAVLASPWIFYQIWSFVAAGLYPHERRYVHLFLPASLGLFLLGAATAFFFVFQRVLGFLLSFYALLGYNPELRIGDWMSFVLLLPLGFGVSFQLPLVMLFLERIGIFTVKAYLSSWRVSVLCIFILAMFLTPSGDPQSLLLMALPLTGLYFCGVFICWFWPKPQTSFD